MKLTMTKELEVKILKIEGEKDYNDDYTGFLDIHIELNYNICGRNVIENIIINADLLSTNPSDYYDVYLDDEEQETFEGDDNFHDFFKNIQEFIEYLIPAIRNFAKDNKIPFTFRKNTEDIYSIEFDHIYDSILEKIYSGEITKSWCEDKIINEQMCINWSFNNGNLILRNPIISETYKIDLNDLDGSLDESIIDYNSKWNKEAIGKFNWN